MGAIARTRIPLSGIRSLLLTNLDESRCTRGLERALDLSRDVLAKGERRLGNSLCRRDFRLLTGLSLLEDKISVEEIWVVEMHTLGK